MNQSDQINEIMGALAKAQSEMSYAVKDSSNPYFKSNYADLAGVWGACREPLTKNGLAVTQIVSQEGEKPILITLLGHSSGQWLKSVMNLPIQKPGPQEIGSCITYCRRYALAAMVGVYQDDDDAEAAEGRANGKAPENLNKISDKQGNLLEELLIQLNDPSYADKVCAKHKLSEIYDIPRAKFNELIDHLKALIKEKKNAA